MKNQFITLIFALLAVMLFAQPKSEKVEITMGTENKLSKKTILRDIVAVDENAFYTLSVSKLVYYTPSHVLLQKYDRQMNLKKSVDVQFRHEDKKLGFQFTLYLKDKLYIFTSLSDSKQKKNYLFVQEVDKESLTLVSNIRQVAVIDYSETNKFNDGFYGYNISDDSSKILIYYNKPYIRGKEEKFGFIVYDDELQMLWKKEVTMPYVDELYTVMDYVVDNAGNVHFLSKLYKSNKEKSKGMPNYNFQILTYDMQSENLNKYTIDPGEYFLTDMQLGINKDLDVLCAGFYSTKETTTIIGSFFMKINTISQEIVQSSFKKFDMDFITQNMTEKEEKKVEKKAEKGKDVGLYEYDLDNIIMRDDGGAYLIGEQYYIHVVTTYSTSSNGTTTSHTTHYYHYHDIIVISIDTDGNIEWAQKIPKKQVSADDGGFYSSYCYAEVENKLYFIFNDNPKNLFYNGTGTIQIFNKGKESIVVMVEMLPDGSQSKDALFSTKEAGMMVRAKVCEQISGNEVILYAIKGKLQKFIKVKYY